ncbi:hypothetical protein ACLOJK_015345 [Asimina triloba]
MQPHASVSTATYTTIPISPADVIARSLQNLSSSFSLLRPTSQFLPLSLTAFNCPSPSSSAKSRLLKNASYFRLNYALILLSSSLFSLLQAPLSLLLISALCLLWSLLYFYREDPLFLWGRQLTDRTLLVALSLLSFILIFGILGVLWNLLKGLAAGAAICALHAILRNGEGLALDEWEAASEGLIFSAAAAPSPSPQTVDRIRTATVVRF